jgi:adenylate cyclase
MAVLTSRWQMRGHDLGFGAGITLGYATCGEIGFEGRSDYAAIGAVTNLASRLADEAAAGQVLIDRRLYAEVTADVEVEPVGEFELKGFRRPVAAFDVLAVRDATSAQVLAHRSGIGPPLPKTNAWRSGRFEISGDG